MRWQQQGEQGTCVHLPGFPDPDLNPRSASCQPGCSQADIAAGAFSAAFPQICLLQGLLKRSPRFLCYSRLHSLPSSKARVPRGPPGEGAAGGAVPGLMFHRKRGERRRAAASRVRVRPGAGGRLGAVHLLKALLRCVDQRDRGKLRLGPSGSSGWC